MIMDMIKCKQLNNVKIKPYLKHLPIAIFVVAKYHYLL